jgi:hypothetical protein
VVPDTEQVVKAILDICHFIKNKNSGASSDAPFPFFLAIPTPQVYTQIAKQ